MDEENFGQVQLSTLEKIVNLPGFEYVKNESLNVSGSKLFAFACRNTDKPA